ncbi:GNAT family N-acetyltransferase [Micromonospora sp. NBC_00362]|uniref:GNAT family N-acetyltransferase n=1 Tax=Micromonospora sp. NBC_00362 TaxID=2975975 RepID=UPI002250926F|nr:GNAT family N-acetyltransferase [Micromonospora sp. NBC_00362]MCX5115590.1 GNAT family N-acetyltransferase [Micromonospora sp. NBC_00362]
MRIAGWSRATPAEAAALAALFQRAEGVAPIGLEQRAEDVRNRLATLGPDSAGRTRVGRDDTGGVAAYGEVADMGTADDVLRIRLTTVFHPDLADDVRAELHHWLIDQAKQLRDDRGSAQAVLGIRCAENDRAGRERLIHGGFALVRHERDLVLAVPDEPPAPALPPGLVLTPVDERYDELARLAHNEAYADSPAAVRPDQRTWPQHATGHPRFLPDLSCLALAEADRSDNPVAAFLFALADGSTDTPTAILHCLGTRAPWRRSGLATAMISRVLHRASSAGVRQLRLKVTDSNQPALTLYRKLGFAESGQGFAVLMRQLTPEADEQP